MFYRVVMQGRTVGGADIAAVKREFVRVTGLPVRVADDMFGGMPKVIKRKVPQSDAERIAGTLRAIGAAATVEREAPGAADDDDSDDAGIDIIASPFSGPPTVAPGTAPPEAPAAPKERSRLRDLREKGPVLLGVAAVLGAAVYFGPEASDWVTSLRQPATPTVAKAKAAGEQAATAQSPTFNVSLIHGPWRCVDQRTGLGVYWSYHADGGLVLHGDVLSDRPSAAQGDAPTSWVVEGSKLVHRHAQGESDAFKVAFLSLARLRYVGERGLEIECRRP